MIHEVRKGLVKAGYKGRHLSHRGCSDGVGFSVPIDSFDVWNAKLLNKIKISLSWNFTHMDCSQRFLFGLEGFFVCVFVSCWQEMVKGIKQMYF